MTQEEKARAYDEALERAKSFQQKYGGDYAGYIFPELRESEDERKRKSLVDFLWRIANGELGCSLPSAKSCQEWIAYLEKQKEQKPTNSEKPKELSEEQLLKEAAEGRIGACGLHNAIFFKDQKWTEMLDKYEEGDKVRVIVLPMEDEK